MKNSEFKLIAIQDWQNYLWMFRGWDEKGNPCFVDPRPAGAVSKPRQDLITRYHPWSNAENVIGANDILLEFLRQKKIRYALYDEDSSGGL